MDYQFGLTVLGFFIALAAAVGSIAGAIFSINAVIDVKALQNSTHSIVTNTQPIDVFDDFNEQQVMDDIAKAEDRFNGFQEVDDEHDV